MVLGWPAGRVIVAAAGLAIVGAGLWNLYRGLATKFDDKWRTGELRPTSEVGHDTRISISYVARARPSSPFFANSSEALFRAS